MKSQHELILDQMYHSLALLAEANRHVDKKLETLLTGGGLLSVTTGLFSSQSSGGLAPILAVLALVFYALMVATCVRGWSPVRSTFPKITDEKTFRVYIDASQTDAYERLAGTLASVIEGQEKVNRSKADTLGWAVAFFSFQIGCLIVSLLLLAMSALLPPSS